VSLSYEKADLDASATTYSLGDVVEVMGQVRSAIESVIEGKRSSVDLALVVDVLDDPRTAAKDLGVLNIAGALPFALAPTVAPGLLALGHGSYSVVYAVAAACALAAAVAVLPIRRAG